MKLSPEYVMKVTTRLISAKKELAAAQAEWDRLFSVDAEASIPFRELKEKSGPRKQLFEFLNQHPTESYKPTQISEMFSMKLGTARTTLSKLVAEGKIEKRGTSEYGAKKLGNLSVLNLETEEEADSEEQAS